MSYLILLMANFSPWRQWFSSRWSLCGISGGRSDTEARFSQIPSISPCQLLLQQYYMQSIHHVLMRQAYTKLQH
jgi:hypothetical protein